MSSVAARRVRNSYYLVFTLPYLLTRLGHTLSQFDGLALSTFVHVLSVDRRKLGGEDLLTVDESVFQKLEIVPEVCR